MVRTRREFLVDVGRGMVTASVGAAVAADMGLAPALAAEAPPALTFGKLEPLVALMQETPPDKLQALLVERLSKDTDLNQVVAAAALANARSFGGIDYIGFHTMMALAPAYHMARELPGDQAPLPVLKVIYRNSSRLQATGGRKKEEMHDVPEASTAAGSDQTSALREAIHRKDKAAAEQSFAAMMRHGPEDAFNHLLEVVQEQVHVHRVVLPYRAWDLLPIIGKEHAHTLLRQSLHHCIMNEDNNKGRRASTVPAELLPKLFDAHKLAGRPLGKKSADDAWVEHLSQTIFKSTPEQAADAVGAAFVEGYSSEAISEALSLAVNQLVLRDEGRPQNQTSPGKPVGSVHGDGIGVHACDSANAWRNMARVSNARNTMACLMLGAYQAALDRYERGGDFLKWEPYPRADARERVKSNDPAQLLKEAEDAIRNNDQAGATAAVHRYGEVGAEPRPVFNLMLKYAISEDGALHAEKYYRTVSEEYAALRPAFRWRQLVALARVTASEYGRPAPGHAEACKLLKG
jgi:hypothetical protein